MSQSQNIEEGYPTPCPVANRFVKLVEAAGILLVWSLVVINDSIIRILNVNAMVGSSRPLKTLLFLAAIGEFVFGLMGALLGMLSLIFKKQSTMATKIAMAVQFVLFLLFLLQAIFEATEIKKPLLSSLSVSDSKFLSVISILTSTHFGLALQAGQFAFMARLIAVDTDSDFLRQKTGYRARAIFWNANMAIVGFWTLFTGALLLAKAGWGELTSPFVFPPNVGVFPVLTFVTGFSLLLLGTGGALYVMMRRKMLTRFYIVLAIVWLWTLLNYSVIQFARLDKPNTGAASAHNGLVFMVMFLATYFNYQME